jgi:hypothetical protein
MTPSASSTGTATGNNELSTGAKAGIGVGAALGAIVLVGLGIFIAKAMRWRKKARNAAPSYSALEKYPSTDVYRYEQGGEPAQLAGREIQLHELPGSGGISELGQVPHNRTTDGSATKV